MYYWLKIKKVLGNKRKIVRSKSKGSHDCHFDFVFVCEIHKLKFETNNFDCFDTKIIPTKPILVHSFCDDIVNRIENPQRVLD